MLKTSVDEGFRAFIYVRNLGFLIKRRPREFPDTDISQVADT